MKRQQVLRRKFAEQLQQSHGQAMADGFQHAPFGSGLELTTSDAQEFRFEYAPDMSRYPAHHYYQGSYRFRKHYCPVPGDLDWQTPGGCVTEEFECAQTIDLLEEVDYWVRNLVHPSQFWMPTSKQRTFPDFVAKLKDGRLFVVEYKGGDVLDAGILDPTKVTRHVCPRAYSSIEQNEAPGGKPPGAFRIWLLARSEMAVPARLS